MDNSPPFHQLPFCLLLVLALGLFSSASAAQSLPELPTIAADSFAPAIRTQINQAYNQAKNKPRDAVLVGRLGMTLQAYDEFQTAAICYERARALAPDDFRWPYYLGVVQAMLGLHDRAAAMLQAARQLDPNYHPAQIKLADALLMLKKPDEAEALYSAVTKKNPKAALAWYGLGRVKVAQQKLPEAINAFERAVDASNQFGAAHYALALALRDAGRMGKAKEHLALYQQFRLVRPKSDDALLDEITALNQGAQEQLNKGIALESEGALNASIAAHEKALIINPELTQAHINLIQLYGRTNQADKAAQHYQRVLEINPQLADAHYNFGVLLLSQQKTSEAAQAFAQALAINPYYVEAHFNLGLLLLQASKLDEAMKHFQAAIESNPNARAAHFELGRILVHKGQLDEAIRHFQQTLTPEDKETPRYLYALAATLVRAGNREQGTNYLRQAKAKAAAYKQQELLTAIERDLQILEAK